MNDEDPELFYLHKRIVLKDLPIFNKVCMQFYFKISSTVGGSDSLYFVKADRILLLNFETE